MKKRGIGLEEIHEYHNHQSDLLLKKGLYLLIFIIQFYAILEQIYFQINSIIDNGIKGF